LEVRPHAYKKALHLNPSDPKIWGNLGALYVEMGKYSEAENFLVASLKMDPQQAIGWYDLGICFGKQGQHKKAEEALAYVTKLSPNDIDAHASLIASLLHQGKYGKAFNTALILKQFAPQLAEQILSDRRLKPRSGYTPYELPDGLTMDDVRKGRCRLPPGWWRLDDGTDIHVEPN